MVLKGQFNNIKRKSGNEFQTQLSISFRKLFTPVFLFAQEHPRTHKRDEDEGLL